LDTEMNSSVWVAVAGVLAMAGTVNAPAPAMTAALAAAMGVTSFIVTFSVSWRT
jgi:hypothetical protein